jgi:hypothetical protein
MTKAIRPRTGPAWRYAGGIIVQDDRTIATARSDG